MNDVSYQDRKCPQCGKIFFVRNADEWAYKRGGRALCSWKCLRAYEAGEKTGKYQRREQIIQAIKDGLTNKEIELLVGAHPKAVWYWRDKLRWKEKDDA